LTILANEAPVGDVREGINDAAAWLVANGHSDLSLDETALILGTIAAEAHGTGAFDDVPPTAPQ
jgi:hypothetical protein